MDDPELYFEREQRQALYDRKCLAWLSSLIRLVHFEC